MRKVKPGRLILGLMALLATASCGSGAGGFKVARTPHFSSPAFGRYSALTGPVTKGHLVEPESASGLQLPPTYVEKEFFAAGNAESLMATATPSDGRWAVEPAASAPYTTRIVVRRPATPKDFNGTVVVEWMNVSAGESNPDWDYLNPELTRDGFAYVGVSAQKLGVDGGTSLLGSRGGGLVSTEPSRYGSLHHPGDQYSYDIFAQIGRALRLDQNPEVLGGLHPDRIVAVGESQSAFFLTTFANAVQPETETFDGIFIHSRGGWGAPLDGASIATSQAPGGQRIRTDLTIPVFMFETETDMTTLGYAAAQQPDTNRIRTWEVAGTSHADNYIVGSFADKLGCPQAINNGPQHVVVQAAFAAFHNWVESGTAPPSASPMVLASTSPVRLAVDAGGNVRGGVRTPAVEVPVSALSGVAPRGASVECSLFGTSSPYEPSHLARLYGTQAAYQARYTASLDRAIRAGYLLPSDRVALLRQAATVKFG